MRFYKNLFKIMVAVGINAIIIFVLLTIASLFRTDLEFYPLLYSTITIMVATIVMYFLFIIVKGD